ncbi:MAG TPA: hemerythrin domain-containing protein [Streptosporangiaceae bacterium]
MTDVFAVLRLDHQELTRLLRQLHIGPTALTGATSNQLADRERLAGQLIAAQSRHEALEAEYFWPAVRGEGAEPARLAAQAAGQEQEAIMALARLAGLDARAAEFEPLLTEVISSGLEHIEFEELQVWPVLRQVFSAARASELGAEVALALAAASDYARTPSEG